MAKMFADECHGVYVGGPQRSAYSRRSSGGSHGDCSFFLSGSRRPSWAASPACFWASTLPRQTRFRVATEGTYKPFSYFTSGGELTGFDVELTLAICKAATLDCVMVTMDNDAVIPALKDNKIDVISTGMSITEKAQEGRPLHRSHPLLGQAVRLLRPRQIPRRLAGVPQRPYPRDPGRHNECRFFQAKYAASDIRLYKTMDEAFKDLAAGRVELALSQIALGYDFTNSSEGAGCKFVGPRLDDTKFFGDGVALGLRPLRRRAQSRLRYGDKEGLGRRYLQGHQRQVFPLLAY